MMPRCTLLDCQVCCNKGHTFYFTENAPEMMACSSLRQTPDQPLRLTRKREGSMFQQNLKTNRSTQSQRARGSCYSFPNQHHCGTLDCIIGRRMMVNKQMPRGIKQVGVGMLQI